LERFATARVVAGQAGFEEAMQDAAFLREQAARCYQLARECLDLATTTKLNALGDEYVRKAVELEKSAGNRQSSSR
jgi:hypothetical protein